MLSKPIYETLPYGYLIIGASLMFASNSMTTAIPAILLFLAGAVVWVLRSNARRQDNAINRKKHLESSMLYELKPFLCLLAGMFALAWFNSPVTQFFALLLCVVSFWIILVRATYRQAPTRRFH